MGEVSRCLGGAGQGRPVQALGRTFVLYRLTARVKGAYEDWLEERARARLEARRERVEPEEYEAERRRIGDNADGLAYSWGSPIARRAVRSEQGLAYLVYLLTCKGRPADDPEELGEALAEISEAIDANDDGFAQAVKELAAGDPNSTPPAIPGASSASLSSAPCSSESRST